MRPQSCLNDLVMTIEELFFHYPTPEERGETTEVSEQEFERTKRQMAREARYNTPDDVLSELGLL